MSEMVAARLAARSRPPTCARIVDPGLNPSLPSHADGSKACPLLDFGNAPGGKFTRRPVTMLGSATV